MDINVLKEAEKILQAERGRKSWNARVKKAGGLKKARAKMREIRARGIKKLST